MPPTLLVPGSIKGVSDIPINHIISWIKLHMYEYGYTRAELNDRILIIQAETGSGKSTVMPVDIFRILRNKNTPNNIRYRGKKVLCTQPRVLTAIELARTVSRDRSPYNPDMIIGSTVGYSTGPKKERAYGLIYATAGTLRTKLNTNTDDSIMNEYMAIIIDEAHERSIDSDILLFMLYKFYKRNVGNHNLPFLILTSATFDTNKYSHYFEVGNENVIKVTGQSFHIEEHWLSHNTSNVYDEITNTVKEINQYDDDPEQSDILIFAPGIKEMKEIEKRIKKEIDDYILVLKLDSEAVRKETDDYINVFTSYKRLPKLNGKSPTRRVIISTSVAETGLTINTLKYVIDMGYHRGLESYPIYNIRGLITRPAPQSRIRQRRGRCGRLFNGEFYPMYPKETHDLLDVQQLPDILTASEDYYNVHLSLYRLLDNNFTINRLNLLDLPSQETFISANTIATILGFIDENHKLTELGLIASRFTSMTMEAIKLIFLGFVYDVAVIDLITIAAIMQTNVGTMFMNDFTYKKYMNTIHEQINSEVPCPAHVMETILPDFIVDKVSESDRSTNKTSDKTNDRSKRFDKFDKSNTYFYRYKCIICDDFIEALLAFNSFNKQILLLQNNKKIIDWCQSKCLNIGGLISVNDYRERIIDELLHAGIDIMYNSQYKLSEQGKNTFMTTIINIKQCLYDSLKHRLLQYDDNNKTYKTLQGISVNIDNSIMSTQFQNQLRSMNVLSGNIQPKYIVTDHINMTIKGDNTIMYSLHTNYISILDGYVYPDITFGDPVYTDDTLLKNNELDADALFRIQSYNRLLKTANNDLQLPVCSLNMNLSEIFGKYITSDIVESMCQKKNIT